MQDINKAVIFEVGTDRIPKMVLPIMETDKASLTLALEFANSLMKHSGETVTIYRNGHWFIDITTKN